MEDIDSIDSRQISGTIHYFVAFDWGEDVELEQARELVPMEVHRFPRRRRAASYISYRPAPLQFVLTPVSIKLPELGEVDAAAEARLFDFAGVSVALHIPFSLPRAAVTRVADFLGNTTELIEAARKSCHPLFTQLLPAMHNPQWSELSEEYAVFQLSLETPDAPGQLLHQHAGWLAGLVRLDPADLSADEITEALRQRLSYSEDDLVILDWNAAVVIDSDCEDTLETIEFANLQLLEFRYIDHLLEDRLSSAYGFIHQLAHSWLPFWQSHARQLRALGELKVEANQVFERTSNVLKLAGDQYLARVYRLLGARFGLPEWELSIRRSLDVVEGVYKVVSDQAATYRTEFLELMIVVLIIIEIVLALGD